MVVSSQFTERRLEFTDQWHEMPDEFFIEMLKNPDTRFESHVDFDLICVPSFLAESPNPLEFPMYMMMDSRQLILLVQDGQEFEGFLETVHNTGRELTTGNLVYRILESLVEREEKRVEEMEQEVGEREELEDVDMDSDDYIRDIVRFRRHLLLLKHLYEHLKRTMEYIVDNDNQLFDSRTLKRFAILEDRSLGMVEDIQVLREEVMQLKEGYQAQGSKDEPHHAVFDCGDHDLHATHTFGRVVWNESADAGIQSALRLSGFDRRQHTDHRRGESGSVKKEMAVIKTPLKGGCRAAVLPGIIMKKVYSNSILILRKLSCVLLMFILYATEMKKE